MLGISFIPLSAQAAKKAPPPPPEEPKPTYVSGEAVPEGALPGAYNQSASYKSDGGWDVFVTGNYICWNMSQDGGLTIGISSATTGNAVTATPVSLDPGYASGFQAGLGYNMKGMDDWSLYAEYTWYKNSKTKSANTNITVNIPPISFVETVNVHASVKYDNLDFLLRRDFYLGKKLTGNFNTGLKALWITLKGSENLLGTTTFSVVSSSILSGSFSTFSIDEKISSWGLGPKFGFDANWLLGCGLKFLSNVSISVPYTRYTQNFVNNADGTVSFLAIDIPVDITDTVKNTKFGTLRPVLETSLALGWGSYFCNNRFHMDLSVGYDFNVFWNYISSVRSSIGPGSSTNMYLHGINAQARFDF